VDGIGTGGYNLQEHVGERRSLLHLVENIGHVERLRQVLEDHLERVAHHLLARDPAASLSRPRLQLAQIPEERVGLI